MRYRKDLMYIMNNFVYEIPTKIYFGENELERNLIKEIQKYGSKIGEFEYI